MIRTRLNLINTQINSILQVQQDNVQLIQQSQAYARLANRVIGRIGFWLDKAIPDDETSELRNRLEFAQIQVESLEARLNEQSREDRLSSALNRIGFRITQLANQFELEHADGETPISLNLSRGTIIVDGSQRPIPLSSIGGGSNIEGYHIVTHLALHKYFVDQDRPTPRFLFLDQPSQVYFSNPQSREIGAREIEQIKQTGSIEFLADQDRADVNRLFDSIFSAFQENFPANFQVIITDHVNLTESNGFQSSLLEIWRDGVKLVPTDWLEE